MHESTQSRLDEIQSRRKANTFKRCPAKHVTNVPRAGRVGGEPLLSSVGDRLHEIIRRETGADIPCPACAKEIDALNLMTVDEARGERDRVVDGIYSRAWGHASWQDKIKLLADKALSVSTAGKVNVGKGIIGGWFDEAIETGAIPVTQKKRRGRQRGRRQGGAAGIGRRRANRLTMPLSKLQKRLHEAALAAPPPEPMPFIGEPVRNMIWHVWPVEGWRKHICRVRELGRLCDGQKIIGISLSADSESEETVKNIFGPEFEYVVVQNESESSTTASGEVGTFRIAAEMLDSQDDNSITIYGHGKGVQDHTRSSENVNLWIDFMYEMVLFNEDAVQALADGYLFAGAYRTYGTMPLNPKWSWHFSGTYWVFRTSALLKNGVPPVKGRYGGVEAWPGDYCAPEHAKTLFLDNLGFRAPYDIENWPAWIDQQVEWEVSRIGGPRTEFHKRELDWFLDRISDCRLILIIGDKTYSDGGLEHHVKERYPGMDITSVERSPEIEDARQSVFDVVFINGDDTLAGVTDDWLFAQTVQPDRVYLHNACNGMKNRKESWAHELWGEIKRSHVTAEKIVGCGWGGIGEVMLK